MTKEETDALELGMKAFMRDMSMLDKVIGVPSIQTACMGFLERVGALDQLTQTPKIKTQDGMLIAAMYLGDVTMCYANIVRTVYAKMGLKLEEVPEPTQGRINSERMQWTHDQITQLAADDIGWKPEHGPLDPKQVNKYHGLMKRPPM